MPYIPGPAHPIVRRQSLARRLRAGWRDTAVLVREFREALILFSLTVLAGAISFDLLWNQTHEPPLRFLESLYGVLGMTFFQSSVPFPEEWYLDLYYFLMPAFGLAFLARGAADFVTLLFNRSSRQSQWEEAVASIYNDHIIVCGLGHLGLRVVRELVVWEEDVVIIEQKADSPRFGEIRSYDIPIITGDARHPDVLQKAGIERAKAIIVCTNDDYVNLQMATRIRQLNPGVRLVMRMFDDEFARQMAERLDISAAMSASLLAAPAFAGAAAGVEIVQTFNVADKVMAMGRITITPGSRLDGARLFDVENSLELSIILLQAGDHVEVHPSADTILCAGDSMAVVAAPGNIKELASQWNRAR